MNLHDFDPRKRDEETEEDVREQDHTQSDMDDGHYPYEDYYGPDAPEEPERPSGRRSDSDRHSHEKRKRDHLVVPIAVFAGLLVVGCLAIVAVSQMDGTNSGSNGMQLQSDRADVTSSDSSTAEGSDQDGDAAGSDGSASAETIQAAATEDSTISSAPAITLGSGTVLEISEEPSAGEELTLQEIYEKVIPSVVSITSTVSGGVATGTGIVMSEDGYVITNYHVIEGATKLEVLLQDDNEYEASLVGGDEASDLAVLKIDADGLTPAEFGSSDSLRVGDNVVAIGDPLGTELRGTMTDGIISAINRDLTVNDRTMTLIQTNAALNSGNSGGPLINSYGQVIGINTMKMSSYYSSVEGLGFAIPISSAKPIIDELIEKGYVSGRPAIGITVVSNLNDAVRAYYDIPDGVVIQSVTEGSDAEAQGLQAGDVIIAFEGTAISDNDELRTLLNDYVAGDVVRLTIWRDGETFDLGVELMDAHDNG